MIVLFTVLSFIIGYVDRMCQSFLSGCVFSFFFFSTTIIFGLVAVDILTFSLPARDKFLQTDDSGTVIWFLGLDRIFK